MSTVDGKIVSAKSSKQPLITLHRGFRVWLGGFKGHLRYDHC